MLVCPHRKNPNWFLKVWSIIFLVSSKSHLSSSQWHLLSTSPSGHLTINPLVVAWDKLHVCSSPGITWCITCPGLLRISCPSPLSLGSIAQWKAKPGPAFYQKSGRSKHRFYRAKLYSWSSREICPLPWGIILHNDFSGQKLGSPYWGEIYCGI